jgi:tetratricopeptide (TPR) repeat protein
MSSLRKKSPRMSQRKGKAPKSLVAEARRKGSRGDVEGAVRYFAELLVLYPDDIELRFFYASGLFKLNRYEEALPQFEVVLDVEPLHEWASLGLFHSLWQVGRTKEAMKELKRFHQAGGESMEYRRLVKEIIQSDREQ